MFGIRICISNVIIMIRFYSNFYMLYTYFIYVEKDLYSNYKL